MDRSGFFWNHLRKQLTCLLAFKSTVAFFGKQHYCIHYCYLLHLRYLRYWNSRFKIFANFATWIYSGNQNRVHKKLAFFKPRNRCGCSPDNCPEMEYRNTTCPGCSGCDRYVQLVLFLGWLLVAMCFGGRQQTRYSLVGSVVMMTRETKKNTDMKVIQSCMVKVLGAVNPGITQIKKSKMLVEKSEAGGCQWYRGLCRSSKWPNFNRGDETNWEFYDFHEKLRCRARKISEK